ncbi:MAG TPA: pyridoxal phosphate-dependent aminotransferase [Burkholderiales bacterium]|nr:pyridoxal phosphate-dependent aminotransferase [Burkholderiales bacterium]
MLSPPATARPAVQQLRASKIREVANAGIGRADVLPFWFGEPDEVTPEFIRRAGIDAIAAGETFYTQNFGMPALREAIAQYLSRLHGPRLPEHVAVTSSGMSALMLANQALVGPGDRVVIVAPVWPNLVEIPKILGTRATTFALDFTPAGWRLDLERLLAALTPETRLVCVNSPNNPTGWTMDRDAQRAVLEHCRRHGIWILADDAYQRLYFGNDTGIAPSFLDLADAEERVVSTNTFSKTWLMTGWRLGWIAMPRALAAHMGTLIEYNTSCAPAFVQRAGVAAIARGEEVATGFNRRLRHARDLLIERLRRVPGVEAPAPAGAMYAFFRVPGARDSLAFCQHLVRDAGLGLAPGIAFGPEGEGFVRWCFAAAEDKLEEGVVRLRRALQR